MFVYQTKIKLSGAEAKDGVVFVSQTQDAGHQIPFVGNVLAVYEDANHKLVSANGSLAADGTFTPAE